MLLRHNFTLPHRRPDNPHIYPIPHPLDHWLLRLPPAEQHKLMDTIIAPNATNHSDQCALTATIPHIGEHPTQPTTINKQIPTTRSHPPVLLPIPKPLIDLYQLGNADTTTNHISASNYLTKLTHSTHMKTTKIDKVADHIINMINAYHELAQQIWPMAALDTPSAPDKLHTPLTNSDNRQLKRLTKLRNAANRIIQKSTTTTLPTHKNQPDPYQQLEKTQTPTQATTILKLNEPPNMEDIPSLCHKAIS
jgi:hypothetical protein